MPYRTNAYTSHRSGGRSNNRQSFNRSGQSSQRGPKKQYINPAKFVKAAQPAEDRVYTAQHRFSDFAINDLIKRNLLEKGYNTPSAIQDKTIPPALEGRDVIGVADTGTGKTAAFAIPVLQHIMLGQDKALIIAPTRELAQQIDAEFRTMAKGSNLRSAVLVGGMNIGPQLRDLKNGAQVIVGTPGRIKDHIERGSLNLSKAKYVVLDEVDRMLDMGFINDVTAILKRIDQPHQSFFFSATLDPRVNALIDKFSADPLVVSVKTGDTSNNVHQDIVEVERESDKGDRLNDVLIDPEVRKVIIFEDTHRSVDRLMEMLVKRGFKVDSMHGGKSQGQRQRSLRKFKQNEINILVATDVAARGIDVDDITHVINYSVPASYDDYIHRIGRAGRAGKVGYALTFVTSQAGSYVKR
jgi:ATP-dependent RNA helicase RhlE